MTTPKIPITLYGYAGGDSELRTLPARTYSREFYDPLLDDLVERDFTTPEREVRNFSLAVSAKAKDGNEVTRWVRCTDWKGLSYLVRKGDRIRVRGQFRKRTYEKDGEVHTVNELTLEDLLVERHKIREVLA